MSMHGGGGGGIGMGMRSMRRDRTLLEHQIKKGTLPRILTFAKKYRPMLVVFLCAVILDAVVSSVSPLLLRGIIDLVVKHHVKDTVVMNHRENLIIGLALLTAGLAIFDAILSLFERRISAVIGEGLIYDLRAKVFGHIQEMPIAFFSRTQTGALISRLNNDVIGAQQAFTDLFSNVVGNLILVTIVIATMFILSWQITLVSLILLPVFLIPARRVGRKLGTLFQRGMELNAEMNMVMTERFNVSGAMLVKLFGRPQDELDYFEGRAGQVRDIGIHQATYQRFFFIALTLTASLATAFAYGFGGVEALHGALAVGTVVALTAYVARLYGPLTQLSNLNIDYMSAMVSFERLFEVLDLEPMIKESPERGRDPRRSGRSGLRPRRLLVPRGRRGLAGVTRSGGAPRRHAAHRRAARRLLSRRAGHHDRARRPQWRRQDDDLDAGLASLRRRPRRGHHQRRRRARGDHGVTQRDGGRRHPGPAPLPRLAAREPRVRQARRDRRADRRRRCAPPRSTTSSSRCRSVSATVVGERGYRLSGGEKQRVALARLLLKAPHLVVLDEATAHLDAESEAAVQRALDETMSTRTSLVIAHRLSTIRNADQILVVENGTIAQRGSHGELLKEGGLYRDLYETQFAEPGDDSPHRVKAAVDVDDRGGRAAQQRREQRDGGVGDRARVIDVPTEGGLLAPGVLELREAGNRLGGDRAHRSGGEHVDADLVRADFAREVAAERFETGLHHSHPVVLGVGPRAVEVERDDRGAALGFALGEEGSKGADQGRQ